MATAHREVAGQALADKDELGVVPRLEGLTDAMSIPAQA
jgi:hypothetical protein